MSLSLDHGLQKRDGAVHESGKRHRPQLERHEAAFDLRQQQQIGDDQVEAIGMTTNHVEKPVPFLRVLARVLERLHVAFDGRQRRAELV